MQRLVRALCSTVLVAVTACLGVPSASAAQGGLLRLAHLSPDTPAVDVYVDSVSDPAARVTLPGVSYGTVSDYREVPPGTYTVAMRAAGASPTTPPVLSTTVQVTEGSARTVAGVGRFSALGLTVLDDDLTPPPAGQARIRVIAAAQSAPTADVSVTGGPTLADGLAFARTSGYVDVPAGSVTLAVTPGGGTAALLPVSLAAGSVYSVLLLDRPGGGVAVRPVLDAAGTGVMPVGGVETGAGGTAAPAAGTVVAEAAAGIAILAAGALLLTTRRGTGRRRSGARHAAGS